MKLLDTVRNHIPNEDDPWKALCCKVRELTNKMNMALTIHSIESQKAAVKCTEVHSMIRNHNVFCCESNKAKLQIKVLNGSEDAQRVLSFLVNDLVHTLNNSQGEYPYTFYVSDDAPGYIFASKVK